MPELRLPKDATLSSDTQQTLGLLPSFSQHLPPAFTQTPIFIYKSSHTRTHTRAGRHSLQYFPLPKLPLTPTTSVRVLLRLEGGYLGLITAALLLMTDCVTWFHTHTYTLTPPNHPASPRSLTGFLEAHASLSLHLHTVPNQRLSASSIRLLSQSILLLLFWDPLTSLERRVVRMPPVFNS